PAALRPRRPGRARPPQAGQPPARSPILPENQGPAPSEVSLCSGGLGGGALGFSLPSSCFMLSSSNLADLSAWSGGRQAASFSSSRTLAIISAFQIPDVSAYATGPPCRL
ncbi:MAG: hypothetical protein ACK55I_19570, partial [bacterium]